MGEAGTEVKWRQSSFAKSEASKQVERDGREAPTTRDASKDRKTNDNQSKTRDRSWELESMRYYTAR